MKATNSAARAARSAAAEPVLRRCPGPKAEQLPPRENKRYIAVIKTVSDRRGNKFTNDIGYNILRFNQSDTIPQDRYAAALGGLKSLFLMNFSIER
jgi:hypothetical protein